MATEKTEADMLILSRVAPVVGDNPEDRAVRMTLVTETPTEVFDPRRGEIIREIVLVRGVEWPERFPLLDSHNRNTVDGVLGSVSKLERQLDGEPRIEATARFSSRQKAIDAYNDIRDGHITDPSVGARRLKTRWLERGERANIDGREYIGPVRLVTKSRIFEASVTPVGADPNAKFLPALRAYSDPQGCMEEYMDEKMRQLLVSRGMPDALDGAQAVAWAEANLNRAEAPVPPAPVADSGDIERRVEAERTAAVDAEIRRQDEIRSLCRSAPALDDAESFAQDLIRRKVTPEIAAKEVLARLSQASASAAVSPSLGDVQRIQAVESEADKLYAAVRDGLIERSLADEGSANGAEWKPAPGAEQFKHRRLTEIGRMLIERSTGKACNLSDGQIAEKMLGHDDPRQFLLRASDGPLYNVSGMFSAVTLDVANNSLRRSYTEAPSTYQIWARRGPNFTDFKDQRRSILGEIPDPQVVPENSDFPEVTYSDGYEGYHVEVYAMIFSITLQAILNNSLNAFTDAPRKMGNAFRRKVNKLVVGVLTANDALADGTALFHANHSNVGTTGAIGETTLDEMYSAMMLQKGLNANVIVGTTPRYVLLPPGKSGQALKFFGSTSTAIATAGNSNTTNIYGPGGDRRLTPIVEPQLAASSTTAWYGIADSGEVDTVEYAFLDGFETPQVQQERAFTRLGVRYSVVQAVGVKALDYRGLFYNAG